MNHDELVMDIETTGIEPQEHRVICIVAKDRRRDRFYTFHDEDEHTLLKDFFRFYEPRGFDRVIGYNVLFDIRFLFARAMKHGVNGRGFFRTTYEDLMAIMKSVGYRYSPNGAC